MALKCLVLLAMLNFALSMPDPDPDVNVNVNVDVHAKNNGAPDTSCVFGFTSYSDKAYLEETCMTFQCIKGTWNYTGKIQHKCGECQAWGDPHFLTYDNHTAQSAYGHPYYYFFPGDGSAVYSISQIGLPIPAQYAVSATFEQCYRDTTCVRSINYTEPGIVVNVTLPSFNPSLSPIPCYPSPGQDPSNAPQCAIKVFVNEEELTIGKTVNSLYSTYGTVLVFKHFHYGNDDPAFRNDITCINIVGSKGFSVSLCAAQAAYYSNLYVWAMPSLKQELYGLCDVYTGEFQTNYIMQNGSKTPDANKFAPTWKINEIDSYNNYPNVSRCENATVLREIEDQCYDITKGVCKTIPPWKCFAFNLACEYDLCLMPNRDLYAQGYVHHMRIESHLAQ